MNSNINCLSSLCQRGRRDPLINLFLQFYKIKLIAIAVNTPMENTLIEDYCHSMTFLKKPFIRITSFCKLSEKTALKRTPRCTKFYRPLEEIP